MHNADSYHPPATAAQLIGSPSATQTHYPLLNVEFSAKQLHQSKQPKLSDLIADKIKHKEFFYGIELTPRMSAGRHTPITINYNQFDVLMPLFTSIVWLGAEYLDVDSIYNIQAVQFAKQLGERTTVLPHFSAYGLGKQRLNEYLALNYSNILIVRGDQVDAEQEYKYAVDLVKEVRRVRGDTISIGVAGYPEGHPDSKSIADDMHYLKQKVDAGADFIITQICYSSRAIIDFIQNCRKHDINVPIIVGIFAPEHLRPIEFIAKIAQIRMAEEEFAIVKSLETKPQDLSRFTAQQAKHIIKDILASDLGIYGFQFFTLNKFKNVENIIKELQEELSEENAV